VDWDNIRGWLFDSDECNWFGVTCKFLDDFGERVGTQYAVTEIDFGSPNNYAGNGFSGTLSADVGWLISLNRFDFASYRIIGTLPESLGQWNALNAFSVNGNALVGSLPESIGQWKELMYFGVKENTLTGTIPSSILELNCNRRV
jgi:hypothetical protein